MDQDWAGLPEHLLDSILEKLERSIDFLRYGAVCASWNSITKNYNHIKRNMLRHDHVPLLLVPDKEEHTWNIYNAVDDKYLLDFKLSLVHDKRFSGFSQGWLVVGNENYTLTLHRPYLISNGDISDASTSLHLPPLFPPEPEEDYDSGEDLDLEEDSDPEHDPYLCLGSDYRVMKALITADPLTNPNDCIIVVIYSSLYKLVCIRYGKDKWTKIADEYCGFSDMVHYKNQLYAIVGNGKLISFDPCNATMKLVASDDERIVDLCSKRYLVESCGELLQVERNIYFYEEGYERVTKMFRVFKFDFERAKWIEKKNLGDIALFVGDNSTISILASDFNLQANCIYFTHDEAALPTKTKASCDLGVYNLESKSFKLFYNLDSTTFCRMYKRPPIWIVPPIRY